MAWIQHINYLFKTEEQKMIRQGSMPYIYIYI
jgi:hypothetical protein